MATLSRRREPPKTPFHTTTTSLRTTNSLPSSSPAFATPIHPIRQHTTTNTTSASATSTVAPILPVLITPQILRPLAFRTFTKKHNLTLTTSALVALSIFVGKHCGSAWREEGLAEGVLEEVARMWRRERGDAEVIVDAEKNDALKGILKILEGCMVGGKVVVARKGTSLSRQVSLVGGSIDGLGLQRQDSFGISGLDVQDEGEDADADAGRDPRRWLSVVDAFEQPRMSYNPTKKHFEKSKSPSTFFPTPSQKTELFRQRYHILHQRVLRNEAFQRSSTNGSSNAWKITQIANLLGRSRTSHLLLGLLTIAPTGTLAISDLTGSIALELEQATSIDPVASWLCPGMIVLVDGIYEEEFNSAGGILGNMGGIGGTIGGRFVGLSIGAPRCETRASTLGLTDKLRGEGNAGEMHIGGGFGWVDFLGVGSERAVGSRMRKIEQRILHGGLSHSTADFVPEDNRTNSNKLVVLGEVNLDDPRTLSALRKVLVSYSSSSASSTTADPQPSPPPLAFILLGNFVSRAALSGTSTSLTSSSSSSTIPDSITYKEHFDALALLLADFPHLLRSSTWTFVPGDNDPWPSAFSAGAAVPLPRGPVPEMFTSRVRRAFAAANAEVANVREKQDGRVPGEAVWTTNPSRLSMFGPCHEVVVFRDDVSGRLRRNAVTLKTQIGRGDGHEETSAPGGEQEYTMSGALPVEPRDEVIDVDVSDAMDIDEENTPPQEKPQPQQDARHQPNRNGTSAAARALTKTLLDQSHLSPFPLSLRPQHWSFGHALSIYPLPTALVLCDAEKEAFACVYQGCCVVNAGRLVSGGAGSGAESARAAGRDQVSWVEVDVVEGKGRVRTL